MTTTPAKAEPLPTEEPASEGTEQAPLDSVAPERDEDTPAVRRKRRVRDSIIEAAEGVFAAEGEAGLSMRRLADRIDYSPAAIYKYFKSKDELLAEIREQFFGRLLADMDEARAAGLPGKERFAAALRAYVRTGLDNPNHYRMAFSGDPGGPPPVDSRCYEAAERFTGLIEELVASGDLREVDARLASTSVWASLHGLTSLLAALPALPGGPDGAQAMSRDALLEAHVDIMIRGLARAEG